MSAIIIPAHNEERGIGRLLDALAPGAPDAEIVVVANGCTDRTAAVARERGVVVLETPVPSKIHALALGDREVSAFPRIYVDGDVVIGAADIKALCAALRQPGVHAVGPTRRFDMTGVARSVRLFYSVWQDLDAVRDELFGRGVIAVDEVGHQRIADWAEVMSDDLHVALSFSPEERRVVPDAFVTIWPPKTYADLLRRRVRAMHGNRTVQERAAAAGRRRVAGSGASLLRLVTQDPRRLWASAVFVATAVWAKARGRLHAAQGRTVWLRDESSRS